MQGKLDRASQALIIYFLICIGNTVKDQFELFLFLKTHKNPSTNNRERNCLIYSVYWEDFVPYCEIVRFNSKTWIYRQYSETLLVYYQKHSKRLLKEFVSKISTFSWKYSSVIRLNLLPFLLLLLVLQIILSFLYNEAW